MDAHPVAVMQRTTAPSLPLLNKSPKTKRFTSASFLSHPTHHSNSRALARKIIWKWKENYPLLFDSLRKRRMPHLAEQIFQELNLEGFVPDLATLTSLMLCYAENGLIVQARAVWNEMLCSSFRPPSVEVFSALIDAYGRMSHYEEVMEIVDDLSFRCLKLFPKVCSLAIYCFGEGGRLDLMECVLKKMVSKGFPVDSLMGNAFIKYYSLHGSLTEMEAAYDRLKRSRLLIEEEGIRAISFAYIKEGKFYKLGEFLRDVGLGRKNVGNLLWNLLLLSYAAKFKMKSLQREFLCMLDAGFLPDLTTFNIRMLAFSRMFLLWDLHLSLEHMKHEKILPDLVTYGCIVDAYLDRRLGRNLDFALNKMNVDESPVVQTDRIVFEVLGKGDFHSSAEAFMEYKRHRNWTYRELIAVYLRKHYRSNQIFWNY